MNDAPTPAVEGAVTAPAAAPAAATRRRWALALGLLGAAVLAALVVAWTTQQRVRELEQELVRRAQDTQGQSAEARVLAGQAQDLARDAAAKVALLEARVAEASLQRSQVEDLIQSLSRSRDENLLADVEAAIRVALQQSAITGSAEPLVATLQQADERLARHSQPRLERVRRAIARDLDRVKALGVTDIAVLTLKLDEAVRLVDELPLLAVAVAPRAAAPAGRGAAKAPAVSASAPAAAAQAAADDDWRAQLGRFWRETGAQVWNEVRALVRVTRIDHPEAMLVAPEQAFFVRENLKLRLLNARLALLSRQFDTAQSDLRDAQAALDRYFDRSARRVATASELVRQVAAQARQTGVPRPDETLAALAAAAAGR